MLIWAILAAFLGGYLYLWRGGAPIPRFHRIPKLLIWSSFYGGVAFLATGIWWLALLTIGLTYLASMKGHGAYMDLAHMSDKRPNLDSMIGNYQEEMWIGWWLRKLIPSGEIFGSRYWYEVAALGFTGMAITLPAGIISLNPFIAIAGFAKPLAYMFGWFMYKKNPTGGIAKHLGWGTEFGEFGTGFLLYGFVALGHLYF